MDFACCVYKCSSTPSSGVIFYSFPLDKELKIEWLNAIGRPNLKPKPNMMICCKHFLADDFEKGLKRIKASAIPSVEINLPLPEEALDETNVSKQSLDSHQLPDSSLPKANLEEENKLPAKIPVRTPSKNLRVVIEPSADGRNHMARLVYVSENSSSSGQNTSSQQPRKILPKINSNVSPAINSLLGTKSLDIKHLKKIMSENLTQEMKEVTSNSKENYFQSLNLSSNERSLAQLESDNDDMSFDENDSASVITSDSDFSFEKDLLDDTSELLFNPASCQEDHISDGVLNANSTVELINVNPEKNVTVISCVNDNVDTEKKSSSVGLKRKRSEENTNNLLNKVKKSNSTSGNVKNDIDPSFKNSVAAKLFNKDNKNVAKNVSVKISNITINNKNIVGNSKASRYGDPYVLLDPLSGATPLTCYVVPTGSNLNHYVATAASSLTPAPIASSISSSNNSGILVTALPQETVSLHTSNKSDNILPKSSLVSTSNQKLQDYEKVIVNIKKKYAHVIENMKSKMLKRRRTVKSLWQKCKRLTKSLDKTKSELNKTKKNLASAESVTWNSNNMSDLGKLIFNLHSCKGKRSKLLQPAAIPLEVRGFVISLFLTSPRAYHIVRDCFNNLPHPKTIARWLSGEKSESQNCITRPVKEVSLEETFTRVIESGSNNKDLKDMKESFHEENAVIKEISKGDVKISIKKPVFKIIHVNKSNPSNIVQNSEVTITPIRKMDTVYTPAVEEAKSSFNIQNLAEPSPVFEVVNESTSKDAIEALNIPSTTEEAVDVTPEINIKYDGNNITEPNAIYTVEGLTTDENYCIEGGGEDTTVYPSTSFNIEDVNEHTVFNVEGLDKEQAVYFVMDEHGNMTGQLCNTADIVFCPDGITDDEIDLNQVPQHEVVIE